MSKLLVNWTSFFVSTPTQDTERVRHDGDEDTEVDDDHHPHDAPDDAKPEAPRPRSFSNLVESGAKVWGGAWGAAGGGSKVAAVHPSEQAMSVLVQYLVRGNEMLQHGDTPCTPSSSSPPSPQQPREPKISESCAKLIAEFICEREEAAVVSSESAMPISCSPRGLHACDDAIPTSTVGEGGGPCRCLAASSSTVFIGSGEGVALYDAALTERRGFFSIGHVVVTVAVSDDGTCCATGGTDGCVSLWSTVFAEQPKFFEGHSDWVTFVAFASIAIDDPSATDGSNPSSPLPPSSPLHNTNNKTSSSKPKRRQVIISGSDDGTVIVWSLQGEILSVLEYSLGIGIRAMSVSQIGGGIGGSGMTTPVQTSIALAAEKPSIHLFTVSPSCSMRAAGVIHDAHAGTLTALTHIPSLNWIASSGEDEVVTISSMEAMIPLFKCRAFVSKRRCVSFMNTVTSIVIVAQPPESSVVVLVACASDGGVLQWIIDPRDNRCNYFKTLKLQIGNLVAMSKMVLSI